MEERRGAQEDPQSGRGDAPEVRRPGRGRAGRVRADLCRRRSKHTAGISPAGALSRPDGVAGGREARRRPEGGVPMTDEAASTPLLTLRSISKTYAARDGEPVEALRDVSCTIRAGEFVSILGPSGCGKSTLMSIIA